MKPNKRYFRLTSLIAVMAVFVFILSVWQIGIAADSSASTASVAISGVFHVVRGDSGPDCNMGAVTRYLLTDEQGTYWRLEIDEAVVSAAGGALALDCKQVDVAGNYGKDAQTVAVSSIALATGDAMAIASPTSSVMATVSGSQPWATLLCRFADSTGAPPANLSYFEGLIGFDDPAVEPPELDHYWRELSYNNVNLDGSEEYDWQWLPHNRADYFTPTGDANLSQLAVDCADVHDANVDFSQFKGIIFIFDRNLDCCAWGGSMTLNNDGGPRTYHSAWMPPWAWANQSVLAHETGHGLGLPHSSGPYGQTYDSWWDVMSWDRQNNSNTDPVYGVVAVHTISFHKDLLGWMPASRKYIADTSPNQFVTLERLALPGSTGYLMAQIPVGAPGSGLEFYTIEARKFAGYDAGLVPGEAVLMNTVDTARERPAWIVDVDNNGNCNDAAAAWEPGELFEDTAHGISMAVVSETTSGFVIVINPTADVAITKVDNPDPAIAGGQLYYNITATNYGPGPAVDAVVTDMLPAGVTFITDDHGACTEGPAGTLTCNIGPIVGGESASIAIKVEVDEDLVAIAGGPTSICNEVTVTNEVPDTDLSNNSDTACTIVEDSANLKVWKDCKPDGDVLAGDDATCTLVVENLGPSTARNVVLTDTYLSDGSFSFGAITTDIGTCSVSADIVTCDFGDLASGAKATVEVPISATEPQDINDHASVSSDTPDPDLSNNQAEDSVTVVGLADLVIEKQNNVDPVAGEKLYYYLLVYNQGPSTAQNVVARDWLPAGISNVNLFTSQGSVQAGVPGNPLRPTIWNIGSLEPGVPAELWVDCTLLPDIPEGTQLCNDAEVTSATLDLDNSNNLAEACAWVRTIADLAITKVDFPDPVVAGQELKYQISITNLGPSTARSVSLQDELPAGVSVVSCSTSDGGTCEVLNVPPLTVKCQLNDIDPGEVSLVFIEVMVNPSVLDGTKITNTATASSTTFDLDLSNNSAKQETTVRAEADLVVKKDASLTTGASSNTVAYYIKVTNLGTSDAQNVVVVDYLPSVLTGGGAQKVRFVFATEGCVYDPTTHTVRCELGTLAAGSSVDLLIKIQISGNPGVITNKVTVTSATYDPIPANNTAIKDIKIKGGSNRPGR